jgi:hypothetical protein
MKQSTQRLAFGAQEIKKPKEIGFRAFKRRFE